MVQTIYDFKGYQFKHKPTKEVLLQDLESRAFRSHFIDQYRSIYGYSYFNHHALDKVFSTFAVWMNEHRISKDEAFGMIEFYFKCENAFYKKLGHPAELFLAKLDQVYVWFKRMNQGVGFAP